MDRGQKDTEKILAELEKRINKEYEQAKKEISDKLYEHLKKFETKDKTWRRWVEEGSRTQKEYEQWRTGQMAVGKRWQDQKEVIARDMHNSNEIAKSIMKSYMPEVYATNHNFATYQVEKDAQIDTSYTLYSKESVERLLSENPDMLPAPSKKTLKRIAENKDVVWNKQQLQSVMIQGILQGESIPKLATRLANEVGEKNRKAAIRNARTMTTGAQNAGRVNAYKRAKDIGVNLEQCWLATMDNRTRHSHRWLDGEVRPVGEAFSNGCEYPGDPKGDPAEIYNCRCSLRGVVHGLERRAYKYRDTSAVGMSYDEWRNAKPVSRKITSQQQKGEAYKKKHIDEYKNSKSAIIKTETEEHKKLIERLSTENIDYKKVERLNNKLSEKEIIDKIAGGDKTQGSCSSLTYAYIGNKHGLDVRDFRGGDSQEFFASRLNTGLINKLEGVKTQVYYLKRECKDLAKKLKELNFEYGKEYRLSCGKHAAIIRNTENGYEYLELQSATRSGWKSFTKTNTYKYVSDDTGTHLKLVETDCSMEEKLYERFGCRKTASNTAVIENGQLVKDEKGAILHAKRVEITEVDSFEGNEEFRDILGYINTDENKQKKGISGHEK